MNVRKKNQNSKWQLWLLDLGLEMIAPLNSYSSKWEYIISKMLYAMTERFFEKKMFCDSGHEISQNSDYLEFYWRKIAKTGKKI